VAPPPPPNTTIRQEINMNTLVIAPIMHYTDSLRQVTERQKHKLDSLANVINEYSADIPFDQLSVTVGIVAFIAALLVVLAQIYVSHLQHKHQLRAVEKQNETQIDIALKQLTEQARENERRRSDQVTLAEDAAKLQKKITQSQLVAEVIAKSRHQWIQQLRQEVSETIAIAQTLADPDELNKNQYTELMQSANAHMFRIELLLHVGEPNHDKLLRLTKENVDIVDASAHAFDATVAEKLEQNIIQIIVATSQITKEAWDTLKEEVRTGKIK